MDSVMDYLMLAPAQAQGRLMAVLQAVRQALPQAELRINHSVPAFQAAGRDLLRVAAYKDHFGLYLDREILQGLKERYPACRCTKSSLQIPYSQPFPYDLLEEIVDRIQVASGLKHSAAPGYGPEHPGSHPLKQRPPTAPSPPSAQCEAAAHPGPGSTAPLEG